MVKKHTQVYKSTNTASALNLEQTEWNEPNSEIDEKKTESFKQKSKKTKEDHLAKKNQELDYTIQLQRPHTTLEQKMQNTINDVIL